MRSDERQRALLRARNVPSALMAGPVPKRDSIRALPLTAVADDPAALAAEFDQVDIENAIILQEQQARFAMPYRSLRDILLGTQTAADVAGGLVQSHVLAPTAEEKPARTTGPQRRRHWWTGRPRASRRKSQLGTVAFRRLDREQRARLWFHAQAIEKRTKNPGQHGGVLRRTGLAVLRALLFDFLNMRSGRCDPGHNAIARAAGVAVSTVAPALDRLETSGLLRRIRRAYWSRTTLGRKILLQDTNAYLFTAPTDPRCMLRDTERRGETQAFLHNDGSAVPIPDDFQGARALGEAVSG